MPRAKGYCGFESKAAYETHYSDERNYADEIPEMEAYAEEEAAAATLSDNDLLQLLAEIEAMALRHYPFPADAQHDPRLPFALGKIAGIAGAALMPRRPQVADDWQPADPDTWDGDGPGMVQPENIADVALGSILDIRRDLDAAANGGNIVGMQRDHIASPTCWCNPVVDDSEADVWLHSDTTNASLQGEDA